MHKRERERGGEGERERGGEGEREGESKGESLAGGLLQFVIAYLPNNAANILTGREREERREGRREGWSEVPERHRQKEGNNH